MSFLDYSEHINIDIKRKNLKLDNTTRYLRADILFALTGFQYEKLSIPV